MNEKFRQFIGNKENVRTGLQIALTIGLIGAIVGTAYDQYVNADYYEQLRQKQQELCQVDPSECPADFDFTGISW